MNEMLLNSLSAAVAGKVATGDMIGADFCHDEYPGGFFFPEAVVEPSSVEELSAVMKLCHESGTPVTVRGAGTGQVGGSVPLKGGIVVSLRGMNNILSFDADRKILTVQPGVLLRDIKAEAEACGMYYPPDPGEKTATIGGNAATNAGGPSAAKYGSTRDYIENCVLVMADGTVKTLAGNEAVLGSEGTLAVIAELSVRLVEKPGADAVLLLPFMDRDACVRSAQIISGAGLLPAVAEFLDGDLVEFSGKVTGNPVFPVVMDGEQVIATLMLALEGDDDDSVMAQMEQISEMAEDLECLDILVGDTLTMKRDFWTAYDAFHTSTEVGAKSAFEYNITVPGENLSQMISFAKQMGEVNSVDMLINAHILSGGLHIHAVSDGDKDSFRAKLPEISKAIYGKCVELGGDIRGEYGIGYSKRAYLSEEDKTVFDTLKTVYDPKGIFNPGKAAKLC